MGPDDVGDCYPFYVAKLTDESVADSQKDYVLLLNAHPAEPCGQEGSPRFLEDLLHWRDEDPGHVLDDAGGLYDRPHRIGVAELLRRMKVYFVSPSPDGWTSGDGPGPRRTTTTPASTPTAWPTRTGGSSRRTRSCSSVATRR
jgi:hypothetical protein